MYIFLEPHAPNSQQGHLQVFVSITSHLYNELRIQVAIVCIYTYRCIYALAQGVQLTRN
jgi:hypothetical protein